MSLLGARKFPTPVRRPLYPFFIAAGITFYGVWKMQSTMLQLPEYANDPKNPYAAAGKKADHH
ncbi:ATPase, F0 complex, subunit J [Auriculariales sp. MPI-PUGE-AT-0066]|nr:ATPase, F0 complex, subunit J [Auriculariales sp. MPI-PUGE-AT-0066]